MSQPFFRASISPPIIVVLNGEHLIFISLLFVSFSYFSQSREQGQSSDAQRMSLCSGVVSRPGRKNTVGFCPGWGDNCCVVIIVVVVLLLPQKGTEDMIKNSCCNLSFMTRTNNDNDDDKSPYGHRLCSSTTVIQLIFRRRCFKIFSSAAFKISGLIPSNI